MRGSGKDSFHYGRAAPESISDIITDVSTASKLSPVNTSSWCSLSLSQRSSGAPLSPQVDHAFRERTGQSIVQRYGSTETGGIGRRTGFGAWQPLIGLEWKIDPEEGRLVVRSPWQEHPDEWFVTDDVAQVDPSGFRLIGRADTIVKVGAKRFSTNEITLAE